MQTSQEFDRPNSAYMLFYERADVLEPVSIMEEIATASARSDEGTASALGLPPLATDDLAVRSCLHSCCGWQSAEIRAKARASAKQNLVRGL